MSTTLPTTPAKIAQSEHSGCPYLPSTTRGSSRISSNPSKLRRPNIGQEACKPPDLAALTPISPEQMLSNHHPHIFVPYSYISQRKK